MKITYYSCKDKSNLINAFKCISDLTNKNYYTDWDIVIDIIGIINKTPNIYDEEGNLIEEVEPTFTDFLFNVMFTTDKYKELFKNFKIENPETPYRKFYYERMDK